MPKPCPVKILQWNCRSVITNLHYLTQHLSAVSYQVLVFQSLNVSQKNLPKLTNYSYPPIHEDVLKDTEKIRTAIYVHENLKCSPCTSPVPTNKINLYSCAAKVKFNDHLAINIVSVYLPRGPNDENTEWLHTMQESNNKWLVLGDFNAHSPFWDNDSTSITSNRFVENIVDSCLYLLNDGKITRIPDISHHRASAIDLSFISPVLAPNCKWETHTDTLGSDHLPLIITFNDQSVQNDNNKDTVPKYNYNFADWNKFVTFLATINTERIKDDNIDSFYTKFTDAVLQAADSSIPKYSLRKSDKHSGNVWWNSSCQKAVDEKRKRFKIYLQDRNPLNHALMKRANTLSNITIAQAKCQFWSSFCENEVYTHKDLQKVWKKFNEMKKGVSSQNYPIKIKDKECLSNGEKADIFVSIFSNSMSTDNLSDKSKTFREKETQKADYKDPVSDNTHYVNAPITLQELKDVIFSLRSKKTSVGKDAVSNEMLKHLPNSWMILLLDLFQQCWDQGVIPRIWKHSILVPVPKQGKSKSDENNYRPVALTSHTGKLMEKIILNRLTYYCDKNKIIPDSQAGFRKGRSTVDHLVKLTTQIKYQFARRKNVLATFFDVKKAYDHVWHDRLLYKLKSIGLSGNIYFYIKSFLSERTVQAKVGNCYSSPRSPDMGIPQGSVISPYLFNILLYDLPSPMSSNAVLVQYADDICMWMDVTMKRKTPKRQLTFYKNLYQRELDRITEYLFENGLSLSPEKTNLVLFNNGTDPQMLPTFRIDGENLEYKKSVKFLGVCLTSKLAWNDHIEYLANKAKQCINFLKVISKQSWGQDITVLKHLSLSLVRSRLSYGQEVFFSAPQYLLKKIQSLDCKAFRIALGVPFHTSALGTYKEVGVLPLVEYRQLAVAKYILRTAINDNNIKNEAFLRSDIHFPKRARTIQSLTTLNTYSSELFHEIEINPQEISKSKVTVAPCPPWELQKATFDIIYSSLKKTDNINILKSLVKEHIQNYYPDHIKIYTDGSVLNTNEAGAAFFIPSLKVEKSFYIGKHRSIFTAELTAVLMALYYVLDFPKDISNILFCVDSKSVLHALRNSNFNVRKDLITEISHLVHFLILRGSSVTFCWVPSHCGICFNERADRLAKCGAMYKNDTLGINVSLSLHEGYSLIQNACWKHFRKKLRDFGYLCGNHNNQTLIFDNVLNSHKNLGLYNRRNTLSLVYRFKLNAFKTKFSKNVNCICGDKITNSHILFHCASLKPLLPDVRSYPLEQILSEPSLLLDIVFALIETPIIRYL